MLRSSSVVFASLLTLSGAFALSSPAVAAVTQPDGTEMPLPGPSGEVSLQELFDFREGAGAIDAHADATTEPSTFRPLCDFTAQLLLHETGNKSPMGWYNSPATDVAPTAVCDETTGMNSDGVACTSGDIFVLVPGDVTLPPYGKKNDPLNNPGQIFTGADIANHPFYAGGAIGFVLLTSQKHYSELRFNPPCTGGSCTNGDTWIPTIMYTSAVSPQTYYMGSEDQAVGPSTWGGNDGDFNDYVFVFTGLVCSGSGEACDTGLPGICAAGLTTCADALGNTECQGARSPGTEECNLLDDDCNGETDEGDICPEGELCVKGRCFPTCGTGEFRCPDAYTCVDGACVETACLDKTCDAGKVCIGGECVGPCDGVVCPHGQACQDGACLDPCAGIDCGQGLVCDGGTCIVDCTCAGCEQGECDAASGLCVEAACVGVTCDAGTHCTAGACVDDCESAVCPSGASCSAGQCATSLEAGGSGAGASGGSGGGGIVIGSGGSAAASASGGSSTTGSGASSNAGSARTASDPGCSCRLARDDGGAYSAVAALAALAGLGVRRRRRR